MITGALGLFLVVLTLLALQVRSGRDPSLSGEHEQRRRHQRFGLEGRRSGDAQGGDQDLVRIAAHSPRELLAAAAVLLALAALAAFSLWGMTPSSSTTPTAAPAVTAPAAPTGEREGGSD